MIKKKKKKKATGPVTCIFSVTWLAGDVKETTHLSERVGDDVPSVVVCPHSVLCISRVGALIRACVAC